MFKAKIQTGVYTVFIVVLFILQVFIAGVPITTASEGHSNGDANAPRLDAFPHNWSAQPPVIVRGGNGLSPATFIPPGFSPSQIKAVYHLPITGGIGTIAIIDAFDDPNVESDLNTFSTQFGLPLTSEGFFETHMMSPSIPADSGWGLEIALDTQWAHAIAPNAKILLVEANSNSGNDLLAAVQYAAGRPDVVAISMSWGGGEFSGESTYDSYFTSSNGVGPITFFASSGDVGSVTIWPSVSQNVVAVGGTTLISNSDGSFASETAWSKSGGGLSAYELEPTFQSNYNVPKTLKGRNNMRAVPDVSYNADPNSGVSVYDTFGYSGWLQVGGTSAGAPQWAAIHSLGLSISNNNLYQNAKLNYPSYFRDITSGKNGRCGFYCTATTGYDYVTGLGSPLTVNYDIVPTVPSAPQNLKATSGNAQITISWSSPSSNGNSNITNYKIYKGTMGAEIYLAQIGNTLTYTDYNVTNGVKYYYYVKAVNSVGESVKSNEASATPSAPTLVSISVTPANSAIRIGSTLLYKASGKYSNGTTVDITNLATWTSSNTKVATISATTGSVTALSTGTTNIKAKYGGITGTTQLTVRRN